MDRLDMPYGRKHEPPPPAYPDFPNSLRAEEFELVDLGHPPHPPRANTAPDITPYLGLRARLSQVWLNRWTVLLLLVLLRVVISLDSLDESIGEAKVKALAACTKVEDVGSSMSSMPHYLSRGVNELAASGVESAVRAMAASLLLSATVVESLVLFFVGAMTDAHAGLASALIEGSLGAADEAVARFAGAANRTVGAIADGLEEEADSLRDDIDALVKQAEEKIFGAKLPSVPKVDLSATLEKLRALDLNASGFASDVRRLEGDAPTFERVKNATERAISVPFDAIRKGINDSFAAFTFDRKSFSLAEKKRLTFCSDNEDLGRFFAGLHKSVSAGRTALVGALVGLALAAMAPVAWLEILRWRHARSNARLASRDEYDPLDVVYLSSRALSATWGMSLAGRFRGGGPRRQILTRWLVAYATSLPALLVLSLALAGFASCLCRLAVLRGVEARVPALAERVGDFAADVVGNLRDASGRWAAEGNAVIDGLNREVSGDVRRMVGEGTAAVVDALGTFSREMQRAIEGAFGATVLRNATADVVRNLSGLRTDAVERGLDWLLEQAVLEVPRFPDAAFSLGAEESIAADGEMTTFLASASSATTDEVSGAVRAVVERLERGIVTEALVATALLLMYVVAVLMGVVRVLVEGGRGGTRGAGAGEARMPEVGGGGGAWKGGGPGSPYAGPDGFYAAGDGKWGGPEAGGGGGDEKYVARVGGGRARRVVAHERQSSYGDIGEAGKF